MEICDPTLPYTDPFFFTPLQNLTFTKVISYCTEPRWYVGVWSHLPSLSCPAHCHLGSCIPPSRVLAAFVQDPTSAFHEQRMRTVNKRTFHHWLSKWVIKSLLLIHNVVWQQTINALGLLSHGGVLWMQKLWSPLVVGEPRAIEGFRTENPHKSGLLEDFRSANILTDPLSLSVVWIGTQQTGTQ